MSTAFERPPGGATTSVAPGGLSTFDAAAETPADPLDDGAARATRLTLGALPLGARLVLRCRKDWRTAVLAAFEPDLCRAVLSVASPTGHTYRVRRPLDSPLSLDGPIPVLGEGCWRPGLARYDRRW